MRENLDLLLMTRFVGVTGNKTQGNSSNKKRRGGVEATNSTRSVSRKRQTSSSAALTQGV